MKTETRTIYCCGCKEDVPARLTFGSEIYPHRPDLHLLPFWKCDTCEGHVGCHHKSDTPEEPLGSIPTPRLRIIRQDIHAIIDPIWKTGQHTRRYIYECLSTTLGREYHTADIRTMAEAQAVIKRLTHLKQKKNPNAKNMARD